MDGVLLHKLTVSCIIANVLSCKWLEFHSEVQIIFYFTELE